MFTTFAWTLASKSRAGFKMATVGRSEVLQQARAPDRRDVPAGASGSFRVGVEDAHAWPGKVGPSRGSPWDSRRDGRSRPGCWSRSPDFGPAFQSFFTSPAFHEQVHVAFQREDRKIGVETRGDRASLGARAVVRLLETDAAAGPLMPGLGKTRAEGPREPPRGRPSRRPGSVRLRPPPFPANRRRGPSPARAMPAAIQEIDRPPSSHASDRAFPAGSDRPVADVFAFSFAVLAEQVGERRAINHVRDRLTDSAPEPEKVAVTVELALLRPRLAHANPTGAIGPST